MVVAMAPSFNPNPCTIPSPNIFSPLCRSATAIFNKSFSKVVNCFVFISVGIFHSPLTSEIFPTIENVIAKNTDDITILNNFKLENKIKIVF